MTRPGERRVSGGIVRGVSRGEGVSVHARGFEEKAFAEVVYGAGEEGYFEAAQLSRLFEDAAPGCFFGFSGGFTDRDG